MKLPHHIPSSRSSVLAGTVKAFTLVEMMTTLAIFSLVVIGMVSLQVFGFKMNSFTSNKLRATSDSLNALGHIRNEVLEANAAVTIGNYNVNTSTFTAIANGQPAAGNAIRLFNNAGNPVTFYLNTNTRRLYQVGDTLNNQPALLTFSSSIVNSQPFRAINCFGANIQAGSTRHYTIKMTLQFSNLVCAVPTAVYDTYQAESSVTPREQYSN